MFFLDHKFRKYSEGGIVRENEMNVMDFIGALNYRNLRRCFQNNFATYIQRSPIWIWKSYQNILKRITKHYSVECKTVMS